MISNKILNIVNYQMARKLHKPYLNKYFNKSQETFMKKKQQLQKKLQIPPMSNKLLYRVFKQNPKIFVQDTVQNKKLENRVNLIKELSKKYQLANVMLDVIYKNQYVLFKMTDQEIQQNCRIIQQDYGFTKEQIKTVFSNYYRTINPKLPTMLKEKVNLFKQYLHLTKEQTVELIIKHPLLIPASTQRIKQSIVLLITKCYELPSQILNKQKIIQFLGENPEIFLLGRQQIKDTVKIYSNWGIKQSQVWDILLKNPILFNNYPYEVMPIKKKLFRYFKFTKQMGRKMLTQYPLVLMSSISSLQTKLIFIRDRLKLPINAQTLQLLQYKFSQIRPRGQILVRSKQQFTLKSFIIDYLNISDEQFCKKIDISLNRLQQEKQRFKQTQELDFRRRKILEGSGVEEKIKSTIKALRQELKQEVTV